MALRFTTMLRVSRRMNDFIEQVSATIRAAAIIAITLIAGCGVPSVTNVTPERLATGEASGPTGTLFSAGGEPVAIAITPAGGNLYAANLLDGTISAFAVQSTGGLAAVNRSPFQTGVAPQNLVRRTHSAPLGCCGELLILDTNQQFATHRFKRTTSLSHLGASRADQSPRREGHRRRLPPPSLYLIYGDDACGCRGCSASRLQGSCRAPFHDLRFDDRL